MATNPYHPDWYSSHQQSARTSARAVVPVVMELTGARSVVDVGCGVGEWLTAFTAAGATRVLGVDGDYVRQADLQIPTANFRAADLTQPLPVTERFDLAVCLEVAEHLPAAAGDQVVASLAALAPVVLFSAAIPRQGGQHHVNEQWPEYWQERFARQGLQAADCLRTRFWADPAVAWYYAQNLLLFVAPDRLADRPELRAAVAATTGTVRRLVHPDRYLTTANLQCFGLRDVARALPGMMGRWWRQKRSR